MTTLNKIRNVLDDAASGYEPAVVASVAAAAFTLAAGLGLAVGDLPQKVNAVLAFLAFVAPLIAGAVTRAKVTPMSRSRR